MNIRIHLTRDEIDLARGALSAMDDNEHDRGAGDDCWQSDLLVDGLMTLERELAASTDAGSRPVLMSCSLFGLICDAVEIYYTDPSDYDGDGAEAQRRFAERLAGVPAITVD